MTHTSEQLEADVQAAMDRDPLLKELCTETAADIQAAQRRALREEDFQGEMEDLEFAERVCKWAGVSLRPLTEEMVSGYCDAKLKSRD